MSTSRRQQSSSDTEGDENCMACKLVGVGTCSGISLYMAKLFHETPIRNRQNRIFYAAFGLSALGFAVKRAIDD